MSTVELDLSNIRNIVCEIYIMDSDYSAFAADLTRVLQQSASIPITIRTLIKHWKQEELNREAAEMEELDRLLGDEDLFGGVTAADADDPMGQDFTDGKQSLYAVSADDSMDGTDGDGKALKKRRTDDFDTFKRNDTIVKDDKKESSGRSKESKFVYDLKETIRDHTTLIGHVYR